MNHLQEAKEQAYQADLKDVTLQQGKRANSAIYHALIAIAENSQCLYDINTNLEKIAEQLERMNNRELRAGKLLDFSTTTRKEDKS